MTDRHLDEGTLQAYIDGELSQTHAAAAAAHLAACEACSAALAEVEDESSFFATAFAPDEAVSVPTAALRARLNAAVAQLDNAAESGQRHSQGRTFGGFLASFSGLFTFTPRAAAAFATLLVAVAAGIIYFSSQRSQQPQGSSQIAQVNPAPAPESKEVQTPPEITPVASPEPGKVGKAAQVAGSKPRGANHSAEPKRQPLTHAPKAEELPGEKEYQTAIASLEKTIKFGGEQSLRPTVRADYERNLALLDSAIQQTRQVAAQNPKDKDAVGFLMATYQSKVELLSRVADQAQVAALGR
ncbi:MAG: zf-HC2 domain-containing protein [Acidobacteria bacterium]|nr:zf-HC2 domain-containing protein [Acidobacteriota bacterium]